MTYMPRKKQWYEIVTPKEFGEKVIGDTMATDPKNLIGRKVTVSMLDLLKDFSKFYLKLQFQIDTVNGSKAYTKLIGHDCTRERIYRMVQRHVKRVDVIQDVVTKDNIKVRVKTVFVLIKKVNTSKKNAARKKARETIDTVAKGINFLDLINMITAGELQQTIRKDCRKICTMGNIEIRRSEILQERKKEKKAEMVAVPTE